MASFSTFLRRVAFLGLITIQSILLSAYLAKYEGKYSWYFIAFSFGSAVVAWIVCLYFKSLYLGWLFRIWGLYIVALVVNIAMVVIMLGDRISKTIVVALPQSLLSFSYEYTVSFLPHQSAEFASSSFRQLSYI